MMILRTNRRAMRLGYRRIVYTAAKYDHYDGRIRIRESRETESSDSEKGLENVIRGLILVAREAWSQVPRVIPETFKPPTQAPRERIRMEPMIQSEAQQILPKETHVRLRPDDHVQTSEPIEPQESRISSPSQHREYATSDPESTWESADYGPSIPPIEPVLSSSASSLPRIRREAPVPATATARIVEFGSLLTGLAFGTLAEATRRATGMAAAQSGTMWLSNANADRLAASLCRMRGAALKLGQMLSIQDESVLPAPLSAALERVRAGADRMPSEQLDKVLAAEFGCIDWQSRFFQSFDPHPVAAASLGQVHCAVLKDGRKVVIKVQYPGVAESIESDVANLRLLANVTGMFPKGLFIDRMLDVVGSELEEECDYLKEAAYQEEFRRLLEGDPQFVVPAVISELTTSKVLTMEEMKGIPLDKVADLSRVTRDRVGRMLLRLTLRELFEFETVQSDPNFANYLYDTDTGRLCLLDFGATKRYSREFVTNYAELVWAAVEGDREGFLRKSIDMGLLTGKESQEMIDAHIDAGFDIAEPFSRKVMGPYDFGKSMIAMKMAQYGPIFMNERLTPPPHEIYSLHRKLAGAFMACIKIKARFPCRDLLEDSIMRRLKQDQDAASRVIEENAV